MPYYIGLMSGTSLDGCDAALAKIQDEEIKLVHYRETPMPESLRDEILRCCRPEESDVALVCSLNARLGSYFAEAALGLCREAGIAPGEIAAIGSHGQTVYHIPQAEGGYAASTLQLGEPAIIAYETGITVVSSFRAMDMAAGGRGAPLVPYPEYLIYRAPFGRALQNLGGIGNVTVLPGNCELEEVFAFDTGPANMVIDGLCRRFFHKAYDENGGLAAQGAVVEGVLSQWMAAPFVSAPPPKATGRELFGEQFIEAALLRHPGVKPLDWIATATQFTAESIVLNYKKFVFPRADVKEIVLSGGGSHNGTLLRILKKAFDPVPVLTQESLGFHSDAKEALAFAVLARETMEGRPGNAPGATGARKRVVLGNITWGVR